MSYALELAARERFRGIPNLFMNKIFVSRVGGRIRGPAVVASLLAAMLVSPRPVFSAAAAAVQPTETVFPSTMATEGSESSWRFLTRFTGRVTYDDNLYIQPTNEKEDFSFHISPSIGVGIGNFRTELAPFSAVPHLLVQTGEEELPERNFVYLNYTPEGVFYRRYTDENALNHDVRLAGQRQSDLLVLNGSVRYQNFVDANIDAGMRLRQVGYTGDFDAAYVLGGKTWIGGQVFATHADYSNAFSSTDARASAYVRYQLTQKTQVGLGHMVGRLDVGSGGDQTYNRPWLDVRFDPTGKLGFNAQVGQDFRDFPSISSRSRFVFALNGTYQPSEKSTVMVDARRDLQSSALIAGQNIVATILQVGTRQRVFARNYVSAFAGYTRNRYEENQDIAMASWARADKYQFYKLALSRDITSRGTAEISYEYRDNNSSLANYSFGENAFNVSASFRY